MPWERTRSTSGDRPSGQTSGSTNQSPRPVRSLRRPEEPAVVEHDALHADRRGAIDELEQCLEVVVEVDRFPGVEHQRPWAAPGGCGRDRSRSWKRSATPSMPLVGPGEVERRAVVGVAVAERDLARQQQLSAADDRAVRAGALRELLDEVALVAAPGDVHGPDLAGAEAERRWCRP